VRSTDIVTLHSLRKHDEWMRHCTAETMKADVPRGLLHGDPFLDNLLAKDDGEVVGWVDWEDVAIGPLMFDVGCAIIGCCYRSMEGEDNLLDTSRLTAFLGVSHPSVLSLSAVPLGAYLTVDALCLQRPTMQSDHSRRWSVA
jgi:aminoglycoside phosphotransferase (APT) family kinase protein